ncbi:Methylated-DNA--protein-cysteine methyltransferase [Roseovarius gaetbuli]|uniref:methylated-DNA--[protein]-cysteine S-methyltransferase n=1 Tax=Roseovarius gaetbuli TaxID=1356575 RepID=A0A1X6ZA01_9RHOB|nr:Methylated-DNA--protein-cysteine methyltransferase [Roseovarius gaetbuli]
MPGHLGTTGLLMADWIKTPLGDMIAISSATHLHLLEFIDRKALKSEIATLEKAVKGRLGLGSYAPTKQIREELEAFFVGQSASFATPLALTGTPFARAVWAELQRIPPGVTKSYSQIAQQIGRPSATRAVARANGANQLALVIPCHRVIGADGSLTGYGGGLWRKQRLLELERHYRGLDQNP